MRYVLPAMVLVLSVCVGGASGQQTQPALSAEAENAFVLGFEAFDRAVKKGKDAAPEDWDVAITNLLDAHSKAPWHSDVMYLLTVSSFERGNDLSAMAWAGAYLASSPRGAKAQEYVRNARQYLKLAEKREKVTIQGIYAAAMVAAKNRPVLREHGQEVMRIESPWWAMTGLATPPETRVPYCQAGAGHWDGVAAAWKDIAARTPPDEETAARQEAVRGLARLHVWLPYFNAVMEAKDWQAALTALDQEPGLLDENDPDVSGRRDRVKLYVVRAFFAFTDINEAGRWEALRRVLNGMGVQMRPELKDATELAVRMSAADKERNIARTLTDLREQAKDHPEDESLAGKIASLAVPIVRGYHEVQACRCRFDNDVACAFFAGFEKGDAEVRRLCEADAGAIGSKAYGDVTALHRLVLGKLAFNWQWFRAVYQADWSACYHFRFSRGNFSQGLYGASGNLPEWRQWKATLEYLIAKGADVNARTTNGWTPLHLAASESSMTPCWKPAEMLAALIAKGADVKARTNRGQTALHLAVCANQPGDQVAMAQLLLGAGADAGAKDDYGFTPLHHASKFGGSAEVAAFLLAKGADPAARTGTYFSPFLREHEDRALRVGEYAPLHVAAGNANVKVATCLLDAKADVNAADVLGETPLHKAARVNEAAMVELLAARGARVNAKADDGETPLFKAVRYGNPAAVEALVRAGAETGATNTAGQKASEFVQYVRDKEDAAKIRESLGSPAGVRE